MERYICIHGHFYQPPRENAWLESVEIQDSAYPYHDWNERITEECYATNAASRIVGDDGWILKIVNNYARISFNFGPTLLTWLESNAPDVYEAILEGDRQSRKRFSGHGSALAQAYNHMILPLANQRDRETQVKWGIEDFEKRFKRPPEGMWLPETAVNTETLEILAENGIAFTILAPHQAKRFRGFGRKDWQEIGEDNGIDPHRPYLCRLPSGGSIALFFYDGNLARNVAFENLLSEGNAFADRLIGAFSAEGKGPELVHMATDGESYGHHHRFGEMTLSYALHRIESGKQALLTNYGEYLEKFPPDYEVEIVDDSSWSCIHGIERWRNDCGCNSGGRPDWHQRWRQPLREALDWLRDILAAAYERKGRFFLKDPWQARNDYIGIIMDRSDEQIDAFLKQHALRSLKTDEIVSVIRMLECQRYAMLMYTSCGWFFDDISGIETVQIIQYAGRVLQLSQEVFGDALEARFMELLSYAESNMPEHKNGRHIFETIVRPTMLNLERVGAHYALASLFEDYPEQTNIFCYQATSEDYRRADVGRAKLAVGRVRIMSTITRNWARFCFGVLHMGDHNLYCGVCRHVDDEACQALEESVFNAFERADFQEVMHLMDQQFNACGYSLKTLFKDEQRKILNLILEITLRDAESVYRQLYDFNAPMMSFLKDAGIPLPTSFAAAAELVLNADLKRAFEADPFDAQEIDDLMKKVQLLGITLDTGLLEYTLRQTLEHMAQGLYDSPVEFEPLQNLENAVAMLKPLPFEVRLLKVQTLVYRIRHFVFSGMTEKAENGDEKARQWIEHFNALCVELFLAI